MTRSKRGPGLADDVTFTADSDGRYGRARAVDRPLRGAAAVGLLPPRRPAAGSSATTTAVCCPSSASASSRDECRHPCPRRPGQARWARRRALREL